MADDQQFTNIRPITPPKTSGQFTNIRPLNAQAPQSTGTPIADKSTIGPDKSSVLKSAAADPYKALDITKPIENYTQEGRKEHPILSRVGDVTSGLKEFAFGGKAAGKPMGSSGGAVDAAMLLSGATDAAGIGARAESAIREGEAGKSLIRINKMLGVTPKEIRVGQTPHELSEFASMPSRGVQKSLQEAGMNEKDLAKLKPIERFNKVNEFRNAAGEKLDASLQAHPDKPIDVQKVVDGVFKQIPDKKLAKIATNRLQAIIEKAGVTGKPLSQLTPMEARTVQRGLDDFANFSPEGSVKSFSDIATALRRGISQSTVKEIPEIRALDQDYGDLAGASKAARRQVQKYATTVPKTFMQTHGPAIAKGAAYSVGAGAGYEGLKHLLP
jgi:hypothetical protein